MSKRNRRSLAVSARSCGGDTPSRNSEWRDWPNLPTVLIDDVAGRLLRYVLAEYIRLRAACKEWRNCTFVPREGLGGDLDSRVRPRRWIMLSNRTDGDGRRFLNLSTGACARVDLPELTAHHLETSADGLLLLRDKASHAARLLNPLTRVLTELPPITADLGSAYTLWTEQLRACTRLVLAGISEETSPPSVVLLMQDPYERAIAYARPCDQRWTVINSEVWGSLSASFSFSSASTLRGRF